MAGHPHDDALAQLLLDGELRVPTTLETVILECERTGVEPPPVQAPLRADQHVVLLSVIQLGGVTLTQIHRPLVKSPALPIAWRVHQRALAAALVPLDRLSSRLQAFTRFYPGVRWGLLGTTLLGGAASAIYEAIVPCALLLAFALAQFLFRLWLRRQFMAFVLAPVSDALALRPNSTAPLDTGS